MGEIRTLYYLHELNDEIDKGNILEIFLSGPNQQVRILCNTPNGLHGGLCHTHMRDLWIKTVNGERMWKVGCGTCGAEGLRKIGKLSYLNGKGHE